MKKTVPYLILFFLLLCGCSKDEVDYGIGQYRVDMVKIESDKTFSLLDKSGTTLYNAGETNIQNPEAGKRILLNYSYLDQQQPGYNYVIRINGASWVHCDTVRTLPISMGNDPITFESAWIGQNYLNLSFYIDQNQGSHQIALMRSSPVFHPVPSHYTVLEFKQDKKADTPGSRKKIYASYDLTALGLISGTDTIVVKVNPANYREEYHILPY